MPRNSVAYDEDFFAWTQEQARLLRAGGLADVDVENLAEEIESIGRSLRRELRNRLGVLVMHLLKWDYQPAFRSRSWSSTIKEQRKQVAGLIDEAPSLAPLLINELSDIYGSAVIRASGETGLAEASFPAECPYTPDQILSEDFLPE
jgi:hypothetical protein